MLPAFCSAISLPKTWVGSRVPRKFRSKTKRTASAGRSKNDIWGEVVASFLLPPAPLIRMSTLPNVETTLSLACSIAALSRTLHATGIAVPPWALIASVTFVAAASDRSRTATLAPPAARALAIAPHRIPPPPVMTTTLPLTLNMLSIRCLCLSVETCDSASSRRCKYSRRQVGHPVRPVLAEATDRRRVYRAGGGISTFRDEVRAPADMCLGGPEWRSRLAGGA